MCHVFAMTGAYVMYIIVNVIHIVLAPVVAGGYKRNKGNIREMRS